MSNTFLSEQDVKQLTGACTRKKQIQLLSANRLPFFLNARGWPVVPSAALTNQPVAVVTKAWSPNPREIHRGKKEN
jgi:Domain of unknown function (DUF4224)